MKKKIVCLLLAMMMIVGCIGVLASCGGGDKTCTEHVDADKDNKCDVCGETITANHRHTDSNKDNKCDVCGKAMGGNEATIDYPWDETQLLFQMTKNSNQNELSSCCDRYLAGEWDKDTDDLDLLVGERNAAAELETKVSVRYEYYGNTDEYGWSDAVLKINEQVSSSSVKDIPDMFCNFVYDMVAASLNSNFANLFSTVRGGNTYTDEDYGVAGGNYFEFVKDDYLEEGQYWPDAEKDRGYMYEYMRSTTLSKTKMYILASDYFTDMVRAFFITPVNIALLEQVGMGITGDLDGDNKFTLDDFYAAVKNNEWTYDLVAEYSAAIFSNASNETNLTLNGTVGFALPVGGLPASGILYSTNITVVQRNPDPETGDFIYNYPDQNPDLAAMAKALGTLMTKPGVIAPVSDDISKQYGENGKPLLAVRTRFCDNYVLFGGIECVGALEELEYQELKTNTGFGVVPVPMYKTPGADDTTTYLTSIHNVGRPGAIARTTTKFPQCTAFLNYQSTHSDEILNTYYETRLQYGAAGGETGTVEMLDFIRNNVRSAFDKTTEDAIGYKFSTDNIRWHSCLSRDGYNCNIIEDYNKSIGQKKEYLTKLQASYDNYPN